jgi:uncharacterized membrane protein
MTAKSRIVILVLALVGLAFAGASTWVHYKILTDASYISPCDVNATFNCSQVYLSPYGSLWGVPVPLRGMFWFAVVAAIAAFGRVGKGEATGSYIFLLSVAGMAAILYLGHASYSMKTFCILCMGTYVAVAGIFLTSGASPSLPILQFPPVCSAISFLHEEAGGRRHRAGDRCGHRVNDCVFSRRRARGRKSLRSRLSPAPTLPMRGSNSLVLILASRPTAPGSSSSSFNEFPVSNVPITHEAYSTDSRQVRTVESRGG